MEGSSNINGVNDFDELDTWRQQVELRDIKAQQQLTKQHYGSPTGSPTHTPPAAEDVKASLAVLEMAPTPDFAEMEKLSRDYQPDLQGPLVGAVKSSKALEVEYASADPAFVRKTVALSPKYPFYRTILGDGNCGWRAVAFGFFELLLKSGDTNHIGMQYARIASLNGLMILAGLQPFIYEDFAEVTFELLGAINTSPTIDTPWDVSMIAERFNNPEISNAIITHFKFLTSSWMKTRPEYYQPFLDRPVKDFCEAQIEPYGIEIEHVGLMALIDCLVLPAGFAVEVFYLDRSAGDEVNVHRFADLGADGGIPTPPDAPVLRLLYRPGHYDIIYKKGDIPEASPPSIQVSFLSSLPEQTFAPTPLGSLFHQIPSSNMDPFSTEPGPSNFRPSMFNLPAFQPSPLQSLPFQTTTFRNSPFNPSHFQSEHFQPEIYQPPTPTSLGGSKRSSSAEKSSGGSLNEWDNGQYPKDGYSGPDHEHPPYS
ncbi:peptidase C65 Otubain-domain-containing protein [Tuber brumale]|nr:peptidase C65 Otubain-domain-containing protein [Tuber brumale]